MGPHKMPENTYSIRYFHRDYKRRDVGYYPDTPLSLNHNLMKGKPLRPDNAPPQQVPVVGAFGSKEYATPAAMGFRNGVDGEFPSQCSSDKSLPRPTLDCALVVPSRRNTREL